MSLLKCCHEDSVMVALVFLVSLVSASSVILDCAFLNIRFK